MLCPFLIFSQSDYLIQVVAINSHTKWQTVQIQISWLLLHCLQRLGISGFSRTRVSICMVFLNCHCHFCSSCAILLFPPICYLLCPFSTILCETTQRDPCVVKQDVVPDKSGYQENSFFFSTKTCCGYSLEAPHQGAYLLI